MGACRSAWRLTCRRRGVRRRLAGQRQGIAAVHPLHGEHRRPPTSRRPELQPVRPIRYAYRFAAFQFPFAPATDERRVRSGRRLLRMRTVNEVDVHGGDRVAAGVQEGDIIGELYGHRERVRWRTKHRDISEKRVRL